MPQIAQDTAAGQGRVDIVYLGVVVVERLIRWEETLFRKNNLQAGEVLCESKELFGTRKKPVRRWKHFKLITTTNVGKAIWC